LKKIITLLITSSLVFGAPTVQANIWIGEKNDNFWGHGVSGCFAIWSCKDSNTKAKQQKKKR
jgi:hypothetical protein